MCGGGGGGGGYVQDNSLQVEMARQAAAQQEQARQDALKAQQRVDFQNRNNEAYNTGYNLGEGYFSQLGLSPESLGINEGSRYGNNDIIAQLTRQIQAGVPDLDTNPEQYYTPQAYQAGLNTIQDAQRQRYTGQVNSTFAPGFEESLLPDSSIDSIIDSILGQQSTTARQAVDANKARGTLNDIGYQNALSELENQSRAGRSTLAGLGESVLGKERGELSAIRGQAGDLASSYTFGSPAPNFGEFYSRAQGEAGRDLQGLEGSILAALGGTSLFDVPTALTKGGTMQGGINLTTQSGLAPFGEEKRKSQSRGLGSTGTF